MDNLKLYRAQIIAADVNKRGTITNMLVITHYEDSHRKSMTILAQLSDVISDIQEGKEFFVGEKLVIIDFPDYHGSQYLTTNTDGQNHNNFNNLPTVQAVYALLEACYDNK